jgi:hypothetical protein
MKQVSDTSYVGVHYVYYSVGIEGYSGTRQMSTTPIKFTITNPCSGPTQITAPTTLPTQSYTITQDELTFEFEPWTVSPSLCGGDITYTY